MLASLLLALLAGAAAERADLVGTLWYVTPDQTQWTAEQWAAELDPIQQLGMDTLVLNGGQIGLPLKDGETDPLVALFEEGDRRGLRFFLDTLSAPDWWTLKDPAEELARACARVELLQERYGRFASFHGFYIPYELYAFWDGQADLIRTLYREVAKCCKRVAPAKPVLISPFFILDDKGVLGDFRWATPEEYRAFWTETLKQAPVDIVALQDSGEHLSCYTLEERAPFFAAMKAACDAAGKRLWANVETGELHVASLEDYTARFGPKTHVNDPKTQDAWRAVPADRLDAKLRLAGRFTPTAITWGYREFIRPSLGPAAAQTHAAYRQLLAD